MKQIPLYEQIYRDILKGIDAGEYRAGDRLPSEKELSEQYRVSRITSKKALEMLAEEGKIVRMAGKGSFVSGGEGMAPSVETVSEGERKTRLIGVIMDGFGPSFGCSLLGSIVTECRKQGLNMVLRCSYGKVEEETKAIDDLLELGVEGILIMCVHDENYNSKVLQLVVEHFPIVTIDRQLKGIPLSFVGTDNVSAARELAGHLLDAGHQKICLAMPASSETSTLLERRQGFVQAFHDRGMIVDESIWLTDLKATLPSSRSEESLERDMHLIDGFIKSHGQVEAFFAVEYSIARIIYRCLQELDLHKKCPVVCFDESDNIMQESMFTHVCQDEEGIGRAGVQLLADALNGKREAKTVLVPYRIVEAK